LVFSDSNLNRVTQPNNYRSTEWHSSRLIIKQNTAGSCCTHGITENSRLIIKQNTAGKLLRLQLHRKQYLINKTPFDEKLTKGCFDYIDIAQNPQRILQHQQKRGHLLPKSFECKSSISLSNWLTFLSSDFTSSFPGSIAKAFSNSVFAAV